MMMHAGNDGSEEMHLFFNIAWFDAGSWAWAHYLNEWCTKGVFQVSTRAVMFLPTCPTPGVGFDPRVYDRSIIFFLTENTRA